MLHTLYQQSIKHHAEFFVEYFALDLIMQDGACRAWWRSTWPRAACIVTARTP
jgi:succinate dehydrogenase/fumarate reductase flavoprotein subunit